MGVYPPQVRHEGALLRVSPLSAPAESFEDVTRSRPLRRTTKKSLSGGSKILMSSAGAEIHLARAHFPTRNASIEKVTIVVTMTQIKKLL